MDLEARRAYQRAYMRQYRLNNPERVRAIEKRKDAKRHDAKRAQERERYATDPEFRAQVAANSARWRATNPERRAELREAWNLAHPERVKEIRRGITHRQRAKRLGVEIGPVNFAAVLDRFGGRCGICGELITDTPSFGADSLTFDHIVPLSRGGPHSESNVQPAHLRCNAQKSAKL